MNLLASPERTNQTPKVEEEAMKAYRVILFALLLVLAACSQAPSPAATPEEESLTSQAVLPGASGVVYYIVHNPDVAKPYRVVSYDQTSNTRKTLYSDTRKMHSVAGTLNGFTVMISMRETTSENSDFEIFQITSPTTVTQLTTNSYDDINISVTRGSTLPGFTPYRMAWETQVPCNLFCIKLGIQVRQVSFTGADLFVSGSGDLTRPTISGNGHCIAFIRRTGDKSRVELYTLSTNTYSVIAFSNVPNIRYYDPSPSDDCTKVAYLQVEDWGLSAYSIVLHGGGGTIVSGGRLSHPHLTSDGKWLTYAKYVNGTYRIKTRNLLTNLETDATAPESPITHYDPFWQMANP
jgi:hypothetical protein